MCKRHIYACIVCKSETDGARMKREKSGISDIKRTDKILSADKGLFWLCDHYFVEIFLAIALIGAFLIRWILSNRIVRDPSDYKSFLLPWCEQYRTLGISAGLAQNFSDYYIPYNIALAVIATLFEDPARLIGLFNSLFDFLTAIYIYKLGCRYYSGEPVANTTIELKKRDKQKATMIAVAFLYLPITFLNSAYWKQCDGIYTCFLVISLYYFLQEKYNASLINFAIAYCFKLQAVFLLPFYIIGYFTRRRYSIIQFLWIPVIYFLTGLPAVIMGRSIPDTYGIYFAQTQQHSNEMVLNTANFYALGLNNADALEKPAIIITIAAILFMMVLVFRKRENLTDSKWMLIAAWIPMTCYMFLPKMHERYDYAAIILLFLYAVITVRLIPSAVICVSCELLVYNNNLFSGNPFPNSVIAIAYCANHTYITYALYRELQSASDVRPSANRSC